MMQKIFIFFLVALLPCGAYAGKINLPATPLKTVPPICLASSTQEKDSQEVFDVWYQQKTKLKYRKSADKAAFLSLVLPGAGQYYAESKGRAHIFIGTDAALWISFFGLRSYGSWLKKDYKSYAAVHTGANPDGKEDSFFEDLTYYESRDEYNQLAPLYSNGEDAIYPQTAFWDWQWDNTASKYYYRDLRNKSKSAYRNSTFVVGLLLANRLVSAIDAIRAVKKYNQRKSLEISSVKIDLDANLFSKNPRFGLTLTKCF